MELELLDAIYKLKENLQNDQRIILLNKIEKEMNESEEVMALGYKKDMAEVNYSDLLKIYPDDSGQVVSARKALYEAKKNLESHPLVREYLIRYREVRLLYEQINDTIFSLGESLWES